MNINRNNYEEFFLLYVDNELSAAERKAVDVFVQENPDLQGELLSLQQAVLKADDIVLEKKDWLFMDEAIPALQENLLLYADDELPASDKKTIEALLATDKAAREEWNILRQTKLEADTAIVFADKRSLYRTEGGRVVGFNWRRVAAAAILIGIALWTGVTIYKNNFKATTTENGIAKTTAPTPGQIKNETPVNPNGNNETKDIIVPENIAATDVQNNAAENITGNKKEAVENNPVQQKENIAVLDKNETNNLPQRSHLENINKDNSNETTYPIVKPIDANNITGSGTNEVIAKTNTKEKIDGPVDKDLADPKNTTAIPVVYTAEENNDRFLYMSEEKVKRTKLGGFIRQAKRVLERTANIKTGEGLKVAGFEIALK
ncbi:MAG TPA: hypothetical protein VK489_14735 [Ferruginibacter sp.]|nr:hypothetical protein [Ferruginibacter sp.]